MKTLSTDIRVRAAKLYFLPISMRVPLKFGGTVINDIVCARVCLRVEDRQGRSAEGWGETPLSVAWGWPSGLDYKIRAGVFEELAVALTKSWAEFPIEGHPLEIGQAFAAAADQILHETNAAAPGREAMPHLAGLITNSAFDLALHDAYGNLHGRPVYELYGAEWMRSDLDHFLEPVTDSKVCFRGQYPEDFLNPAAPEVLAAWHLVGGLDPLDESELTGDEPQDGYPVHLKQWIERDGLQCLKLKLRGNDPGWDYKRIVDVGRIALTTGVTWLSTDFNCTAPNAKTVNEVLDRLMLEEPQIYGMILYVEQPFAYDLEANQEDVHSVSARKPLFMDESAHDWRMIRLGRSLGWSGVALKTCKTQTGALLSACWAKAHGMPLMVQDLTNPMLAIIPHALLAAKVGTIMGVETNACQFYPDASREEAGVHGGLYQRRNGTIQIDTLAGSGFGYRLAEIHRSLPKPRATAGNW